MRYFLARFEERHKLFRNFDEILWKIEFFYLGKFVTPKRAFGNKSIFLQFFRFRAGGGDFALPPGYALANPPPTTSDFLPKHETTPSGEALQ